MRMYPLFYDMPSCLFMLTTGAVHYCARSCLHGL